MQRPNIERLRPGDEACEKDAGDGVPVLDPGRFPGRCTERSRVSRL